MEGKYTRIKTLFKVLKLTGNWKSPGGDVKMFTASDGKFVFEWQGSKKKKIEIVKDHDASNTFNKCYC